MNSGSFLCTCLSKDLVELWFGGKFTHWYNQVVAKKPYVGVQQLLWGGKFTHCHNHIVTKEPWLGVYKLCWGGKFTHCHNQVVAKEPWLVYKHYYKVVNLPCNHFWYSTWVQYKPNAEFIHQIKAF